MYHHLTNYQYVYYFLYQIFLVSEKYSSLHVSSSEEDIFVIFKILL